MAKHRSPIQSQGKNEKKMKRKDSSDSETMSLNKFEDILKRQPVVLLEKLPSNISTIPNTPKSSTLRFSLKSQEKTSHGPKKTLAHKLVSEISNSQSSPKRSKPSSQKTSTKCKDASRSQNCLKKNNSTASFVSTEGSLDEEFAKYGGSGFRKIQKVCTRDPMRVTPCSDVCCIEFSNPADDEKKKQKKKESSSAKKISRSQPIFKTKLNSSQKPPDSTLKRKKLKNEISKKKESTETCLSSSSSENSQTSLNQSSRFVLFTKKSNSSSQQIKTNSTLNPSPNSSSNSSIKTPSLFKNRIGKRSEYFPNLSMSNLSKSELNTNCPKAPAITEALQTQMLEASTFPKTSGPNINSTSKTKCLYTQCNMKYISPLSYSENELKVNRTESRGENYSKLRENNNIVAQTSTSNQNEIPNVSYTENSFLMNNHQFSNTVTTNHLDDSFRNLSLERIPQNGTCLSEIKLEGNVYNFPTSNTQPSTNNDFHLAREGTTFGDQLSYTESNVKESTLSNIEKEDFLMDDFQFPLMSLEKIMDSLDTSLTMETNETTSQRKNIKIKDIETIPTNCIQLIPRPKAMIKNENLSPNKSQAIDKVCDQEKVAVINIQNLEQLRKDELTQSQESYDYNNIITDDLINNYLPITQDVNALVNSSIVDPNNDLLNLNCDGFIENDIVNNNEKLLSQNGEQQLSPNFHDVKEILSTGPPAEMLQLHNPSGRTCLIPATGVNDFLNKANEITMTINHTNFELDNSNREFKEPVQNQEKYPINDTIEVTYPRKRKWCNENRKNRSETGKKIKLNRRRWSRTCNESDDFTDTSSEVSSSCLSSFCENDNNNYQNQLETFNTLQSEIIDKPNENITKILQMKQHESIEIKHESIEIEEHTIFSNQVDQFQKQIQFEPKIVAVEESRVDPEPQPEPEREEFIQLNQIQEISKCPSPCGEGVESKNELIRKKRRVRSSKFSPSSLPSDSSSEDEDIKLNSASDDERVIEDKCGLLKQRFQRELSHIQSDIDNIDNDKLLGLNTSGQNIDDQKDDDQKEDDAISLCASPSLMELSSRCDTPLFENRTTTQSDCSNIDESYWDAFKRKNDVDCDFDLRSYLDRSRQEKNQENGTNGRQVESRINPEDLFTKPVRSVNSNNRVNNVRSRIEPPSTSNAADAKINNVRTKIEAPTNDNSRVNIVRNNIQVASNSNNNVTNATSKVEVPTFHKNATNFTSKIAVPSNLNSTSGNLEQNYDLSKIFYGTCHIFLIHGNCTRHVCLFKHEIPDSNKFFQNVPETTLYNMMCDCMSKRFFFYLKKAYGNFLQKFSYPNGMQFFQTMLIKNWMDPQLLEETVEFLRQKLVPLPKVIQDISEKFQIVHPLLQKLPEIIDKKATTFEYWESMRFVIRTTVLTNFMLEKILLQCLNENTNIERITEVYQVFIEKHLNERVKEELWFSFYNLIYMRLTENFAVEENLDIDDAMDIVNNDIASPDPTFQSPIQNPVEPPILQKFEDVQNLANFQNEILPNIQNEIPPNVQDEIPPNLQNDNSINFQNDNPPNLQNDSVPSSSFARRIENVPPPKSVYRDKDNLWKFYDRLESMKRGLQHRDYDHVVHIILQYSKERSPFTRHCHRILCEEINKSQTHVENVIKAAVQDGELSKMRDILSRLGTNVLIELADRELWIYANELLKTLQKYELYNNNAGLTLLAAEIYLANQLLSEAFWLLRESNIIFTNCTRWKVKSRKEDMGLRVSVVTLLLESLCQNHAQEAFFIFDLILGEQSSNAFPINLTRLVDRLMLSLISQDRTDCVINLCKKAMRYHLNFHEITYRAVITSLVPVDIDLARQFFQYATFLGVYPTAIDYPVMNVIANVDWTEEEMYLVISEFLRKLSLEAGFAISRIGNRQLSAFFIFESIPSRRELLNNISNQNKKTSEKKLKLSKEMLKNILETRFDPPIRLIKREQGKICKINGESLVAFLKSGNINN
ncbi:uncharacterized protein LOC122497767 [Leptopilina heterotoma]|uniref:uncharacterized protein LOC122497767 n=1 Tax=Leptopilina heterotoma TaxID=63436 RepID=UPI001CA8BC3D|nr:uncharacterized protein LOC122497767 [Leptopilina heterotoma]XP_043460979.1 uncharacterized protein LOC122497767 [Leptopilina heterotoma]